MPDTEQIPIVEDDDPDAPGAPISVPDSGESGEGGKLKMIIGLLKRSLGVKDIAAMRLSLPASLLEPVPNLEYWCYLDRPDLFVEYVLLPLTLYSRRLAPLVQSSSMTD